MFFNVLFSFLKMKGKLVMIYILQNKTSGAILHGTSYEPEATREATRL